MRRRARSQSWTCVSYVFSLFAGYRLLEDFVQDRCDVAAKLAGVLAHRKMTELLHDGDAGARNRRGRPPGIFRRAREIILAGEQIQRTDLGIDGLDPAAQIAVDAIEVQIALEDARAALLVGPQRFVSRDFGA